MVQSRIDKSVWHGLAVLDHQHRQLRALQGRERRRCNACTVALRCPLHRDVKSRGVLSSQLFVEDVSLDIGPSIVATTGGTGLHHEGRRGGRHTSLNGFKPVNAVLAGRRLEGVFAVRRMQRHQGDAGAVAVGHLQEFRVDFCTTWAPRRRDFFNQHRTTAAFGGDGPGEFARRTDDHGLPAEACKESRHEEGEGERLALSHGFPPSLSTATGWTALIACFGGDLGKGFMKTRYGGRLEDTCMAEHWVENHKRDAWRRQAKASGYRARSAFKLKQIQERFNLVRNGDLVLDVGCHPGGWAQVAVELVGEEGRVVGVDLMPCAPVEGAVLLTGDITDPITQERILAELNGELLNVIVSDISPDITGKWDMDQSVAMTLVADVFDFALPLLTKGGGFTTKLFQGIGVEELITAVRPHFSSVRRFSPDASRNSSSEVYLVCKHHTPWKAPKASVRERYEEGVNKIVGGDEIEADPEIVASSFRVRKKKTSSDLEEG